MASSLTIAQHGWNLSWSCYHPPIAVLIIQSVQITICPGWRL